MTRKCETCEFFEPRIEKLAGYCRRNPPQPTRVVYRRWFKLKTGSMKDFPIVAKNDWCGEWKEKEGDAFSKLREAAEGRLDEINVADYVSQLRGRSES